MPAHLDHLIIPARDRVAAAKLVAHLFNAGWSEQGAFSPFSPVYINENLTLDFDQWTEPVPKQHYCFRVSNTEFDAILERIQNAGIEYRSTPVGAADNRINQAFGGKLVYWGEPDGHAWEILTASYARQNPPTTTEGDA